MLSVAGGLPSALELLGPKSASNAWQNRRNPWLAALVATVHVGALIFIAQHTATVIAERPAPRMVVVSLRPSVDVSASKPDPKPIAKPMRQRAQPKTEHSSHATPTLATIAAQPREALQAGVQIPSTRLAQDTAPLEAERPALSPTPPREEVEPRPPQFDLAYLANPAPPYPALSRRLREQGQVVLRVEVDKDGNVLNVTLKQSSGFGRLDQAALAAVRSWRFQPAKLGAISVAGVAIVPIEFELTRKS